MSSKISLEGKTAVITGASRGIGEATARHLASNGVNVVLAARSIDILEKIANDIRKQGGKAIAVKVDVSIHNDNKKLFEIAEKEFGGVDFVFANAAHLGSGKDFAQSPFEEIKQIIEVNVIGYYSALYYAIPQFRKRGGGAIVFVSSLGSVTPPSFLEFNSPSSNTFGYGASKAAVDGIARSCASLLKENIRAYSILPGVFATEMAKTSASFYNLTFEQLGNLDLLFNTVGKPESIGYLVEHLFNNTVQIKSGHAIIVDNDAYFSAHEVHKTLETDQPLSLDRSKIYNVKTNELYDFASAKNLK